MDPVQQWIVFAIGCAAVVVGGCLMAWSALQRRTVAGASVKEVSALLKAAAGLVDSLARFFPNAAARVGLVLIALGCLLVFFPFFLP